MSMVGAPAAPVLCLSADIDLLHGGCYFGPQRAPVSPEKVTHAIVSAAFCVDVARRSATLKASANASCNDMILSDLAFGGDNAGIDDGHAAADQWLDPVCCRLSRR